MPTYIFIGLLKLKNTDINKLINYTDMNIELMIRVIRLMKFPDLDVAY